MEHKQKIILQKGKGRDRKQQKLKYIYEKESIYFAQVSESIKDLAIAELRELGGRNLKPQFRGVQFEASKEVLYSIVYKARLISRVLAPLTSFKCHDGDDIYKHAKRIQWEEFITHKKSIAVHSNVSESQLNHSQYAGLRLKDAIVDYFRDRTNKRPNVDPKDPDLQLNLHVNKDIATVSIDVSGGSLHKRGYREENVPAPMQEVVAAAIIRLSGWDGSLRLHDPMCGSGTILCEALMAYTQIPAGIFRQKFGFERLPDFDGHLFEQIKDQAKSQIKELPPHLISGSDISPEAVDASKTNIMGLHFGNRVQIDCTDFNNFPGLEKGVIITNPPYGIRLEKGKNLNDFYKNFGDFLKTKCRGSSAFVYFGEPRYRKKIGLKPAAKHDIKLGGLDGLLAKYEIY